MNCINPYRLKNPKFPDSSNIEYLNCACGKCYNCLVNRRRLWWFRLFHESLINNSCYFLTLTYNDDTNDGYLHPQHFTKFVKRLRTCFPFTYYSIGEYGTKSGRPHYHLIVFANDIDYNNFFSFAQSKWPFGFVHVGSCTSSSINYVLHYHVRPKEPVKGKRTFQRFSKFLGLSFLFDRNPCMSVRGDKIVLSSCISLHSSSVSNALLTSNNRRVSDGLGHVFILPRYYVKKLQELGYDIPEPDFNDTLPFVELFQTLYPDAVFNNDGECINYPDSRVASILHDFMTLSEKKLRKYNYQTKNSL